MDLCGEWAAAISDDELRRVFAEPELDTDGWERVAVPGHWRSVPAFAGTDGPLVYRTRFEAGAEGGRRSWLRFDGLFYQGDIWLDGTYLGDSEGYFVPHTFEITGALADRREHALAVEVTCARPTDRTAKRDICGVFQHWDCFDPSWNPGGIWRPVSIVDTGPVRISDLACRCVSADDATATVAFRATLDALEGTEIAIVTNVGGVDDRIERELASGDNTVEWTVTVDRPRLWWPHALGQPHLTDVTVDVLVPEDPGPIRPERPGSGGHVLSDRRAFRTGLRSIELEDWIASVNGERLFLKGANQGPTRMALADATADECRRDVALAVEAGLDLLRLHAHVARPETYEAADEAGLLLWQDFPLQWGYARQIRKQAMRQATAMVSLLAHHPSIAIWCGHNEPIGLDPQPADFAHRGRTAQLGLRAMAAQQLPTWNKTILDRSVKRAISRADGTRPVIPHSGVLPHLPKLDGTDSHLYFGWYWGDERDFPAFCKAVPRMVRFVTEFGAQAVPDNDDFMEPHRWPDLGWDRLAHDHAAQPSILERYVPSDEHGTYEAWKEATQRYQADVIRFHVETLRRLKYRPAGGFAQFCFADGHPGVTWSVLDHLRAPKAGYAALARACRPVIVVADRLAAAVQPGDAIALDVPRRLGPTQTPRRRRPGEPRMARRQARLALRRRCRRRHLRARGDHPVRGPRCARTARAGAGRQDRRRRRVEPLRDEHRRAVIRLLRLGLARFRSPEDYRAMQRYIADRSLDRIERSGIDLASSSVLELGCGHGGYSTVLHDRCRSLLATDIERDPAFEPEGPAGHVAFEVLDVRRPLPLPTASVDVVFCSSLIEHVEDPALLMREARRVLRDGGSLYLSFPPYWSLSMVGGHNFKPFHLLGERLGLRVHNRVRGDDVASMATAYGDYGLFPLRIDQVGGLLAAAGFEETDRYTRLSRWNTTRLPGVLADLATWHACFHATPTRVATT